VTRLYRRSCSRQRELSLGGLGRPGGKRLQARGDAIADEDKDNEETSKFWMEADRCLRLALIESMRRYAGLAVAAAPVWSILDTSLVDAEFRGSRSRISYRWRSHPWRRGGLLLQSSVFEPGSEFEPCGWEVAVDEESFAWFHFAEGVGGCKGAVGDRFGL